MNFNTTLDVGALRQIIRDRLSKNLGPNALAFCERVYSSGLGKYSRRLQALGLAGGHRALDAGCGLGQWSFALAALCDEVHGIDVSPERIDACLKIGAALEVNNAQFTLSGLEALPFKSDFFDRVVCYSVLYLTWYEKSIQEFSRVTAPGGLVYLSTNDAGRYVYDIMECPNPAVDFNPRRFGLQTFWNTLIRRRSGLSPATGGVVMSKARTIRLLEKSGFEIIDSGEEGRIMHSTESFMPGRYWGLVSTFDVLARKR